MQNSEQNINKGKSYYMPTMSSNISRSSSNSSIASSVDIMGELKSRGQSSLRRVKRKETHAKVKEPEPEVAVDEKPQNVMAMWKTKSDRMERTKPIINVKVKECKNGFHYQLKQLLQKVMMIVTFTVINIEIN